MEIGKAEFEIRSEEGARCIVPLHGTKQIPHSGRDDGVRRERNPKTQVPTASLGHPACPFVGPKIAARKPQGWGPRRKSGALTIYFLRYTI
jgi:hypothetical protein